MKEKATAAGKLVNPISGGIRIQPMRLARDIDRALLLITSFNGKENLAKAGVHIPDYYDGRGGFHSVEVGLSQGNIDKPASSPAEGFDAAMRRGAGLAEPAPAPTD
jgi:hypothetical protein